MADLLNRVGRSASSYLVGQEGGSDLGFIGSIVEVDGMQNAGAGVKAAG